MGWDKLVRYSKQLIGTTVVLTSIITSNCVEQKIRPTATIKPSATLEERITPTYTWTPSPIPIPTLTHTSTVTPTPSQEDILASLKTSNTGDPYSEVRFTDDYRELPYKDMLIDPEIIILHWDGQLGNPNNWARNTIFNGLSGVKERYELMGNGEIHTEVRSSNSHFGVDKKGITQYLPMFEEYVQHSYGAFGFPEAINIEMAGSYFTYNNCETNVPKKEVENTLDLTVQLMIQYNIGYENVFGHYEKDSYITEEGILYDRGKPDPGQEFMKYFRQILAERLNYLELDLGQPEQ